jgi:glucose uptake protein
LKTGAQATSRRGVVICVISGLLMGIFAPFVTRAMTRGATLTPYTTAVCLTFGAFFCCFFFNTILMRKPIVGSPVAAADYFRAPASYHALGLLGGAIWGIGGVFNFVAASLTGVAISYAIGQASPMVACLWGVFAWKEFRGANTRAKSYLASMFVAYALALFLIARAYAG